MSVDNFLARGLWLDLETGTEKLNAVGGFLGEETCAETESAGITAALTRLDELATRADYVAGHNLLEHDLPFLQERYPHLRLLKLPVVDTLLLSPLAFPQNPHHRLVKDYKLVRDSVNDPLADARLAATLLRDEFGQFVERQSSVPHLTRFCRVALEGAGLPVVARQGFAQFFDAVGVGTVETGEVGQLFASLIQERVCRTALTELLRINPGQELAAPAAAYAVTWITVAGHNSVLPPWVRHQFPETGQLIDCLRGRGCADAGCEYCRFAHNPLEQLRKFFGFSQFRPLPAGADGGSMQEEIVRAGMRGRPLLALLPTGGGKSLCYQVPALARHFQRGSLTIIITPLQALMKDQVDNLLAKTGLPLAGALSGMLTPPERGDTLERVRLGDIALLYVAPEQLRNKSFRECIKQREIGAWVFDEAHCLSKWGHDFRPDYLYAARFIRELAQEQNVDLPPVMGFTATAKRDVIEEIVAHFRTELGQEFTVYNGGTERDNLKFDVQIVSAPVKQERVDALLHLHLEADPQGAAVVYSATRSGAEKLAEYLATKNWRVAAFHAGLNAANRGRIQDEFLRNELRVICATNAFGMGVDKENVRVVIHADIPGSVENYLQEAGRAGRDRQTAQCILLYDQQDIERQFTLGALSELSQREVKEILRAIKRARRNRDGEVIITTGELLRDQQLHVDFDVADRQADTKVKTAISLLEQRRFIQRNENRTNVFQGRPLVRSLAEAREKMARLNLSPQKQEQWEAIFSRLINSPPDEGFSADSLAELPALREAFGAYRAALVKQGQQREAQALSETKIVMSLLNEMVEAGLIKKDMLLTAFVKHGGPKSPRRQFEKVCALEEALLKILPVEEPDPTGWLHVHLPRLNQRVCDEDHACVPETITSLLRNLAFAGRGFGTPSVMEYRAVSREQARVKLNHDWPTLLALAQRRRAVASIVLRVLVEKIPVATPVAEECLVAFSFDDITKALEADLVLLAQLRDRQTAIEHALLFLHEQKIIILQQGLAVFRQSMTIRIQDDAPPRFTASDYDPLSQHYDQRVFQVHVMNEYARLGLEKIGRAVELVLAYFTMDRKEFIQRFFRGRREVLDRATTDESYRQIVEDLQNPTQQEIVSADTDRNLLILAGPGAGKTRVVVHRCAYLLRVKRQPASSILVLCFNRHAAQETRRRLFELIGADARFITVQTYHGLAMRLVGASFADRPAGAGIDFDAILDRAIQLLRGEADLPGLAEDELRDRLLAGYRFILVDEYQDIDEKQYALISALAGRTLADPDSKLNILAVGDDDQNIYTFRGANVKYIRQFQQDYVARTCHLLENYRSTSHIITTANYLIEQNHDRMKIRYSIVPNKNRHNDPPGGLWQKLDSVGQGRVQILTVADEAAQASAVIDELMRLRKLHEFDWSACAILAHNHDELAPLRTLCETRGIPVRWSLTCDGALPLTRVREICRFVDCLREKKGALVRASEVASMLPPVEQRNHWHRLLDALIASWREETENAEQPAGALHDFIYTTLAEERREQRFGNGLLLSTVHGAKGMEYDHVTILGDNWLPGASKLEEERRLFYVGMTRARQMLLLPQRNDARHRFVEELAKSESVKRRAMPSATSLSPALLARRYTVLGLRDIFLDYAGRMDNAHPVHAALKQLQHNDPLRLCANGQSLELITSSGLCVARLSQAAVGEWGDRLQQIEAIRILALCARGREDVDKEDFHKLLRCDNWEVPVVEIVWRHK